MTREHDGVADTDGKRSNDCVVGGNVVGVVFSDGQTRHCSAVGNG
jgi:hypothetical protein